MKYLLLFAVLCLGCEFNRDYEAVKLGKFYQNINQGYVTVKILHVELSQGHRPNRVIVKDEDGHRFVIPMGEPAYGEFGLYPQVGEDWWMNKKLELVKQPEA